MVALLLAGMCLTAGGCQEAGSIGIIGGADGPTAIFVTGAKADGEDGARELLRAFCDSVRLSEEEGKIFFTIPQEQPKGMRWRIAVTGTKDGRSVSLLSEEQEKQEWKAGREYEASLAGAADPALECALLDEDGNTLYSGRWEDTKTKAAE